MLLHRAAAAAGPGSAPEPGQYVAVETREEALSYVTDDDGDVVGAYVDRRVSTTYVPYVA